MDDAEFSVTQTVTCPVISTCSITGQFGGFGKA